MAPDSTPETPVPDPAVPWRRQIANLIEAQLVSHPLLFQLRAVWRQLEAERANWSFLLPLVAVVFFVVYRRERKLVLREAQRQRRPPGD